VLNCSLLLSHLYDNHFRQLTKCLHNVTTMVNLLLLCVGNMKSILFHHFENHTIYRTSVLDMKCLFHFYLQYLLKAVFIVISI
jgi:hypothetical protein